MSEEGDELGQQSLFDDYMRSNPFTNPSDDKIFTFKEEER